MKIILVDDHPLVRKGICSTLSFEDDIEKITEASSVQEAIEKIEIEKPDLAIVDLNLGYEDGLDIISYFRDKKSKIKFLILTSSIKKEDFIRSKELDVDGYILKEAFAEDIIYAIRVVLRGKRFIDPEIMKYQTKSSHEYKDLNTLTPREDEVLLELSKGLSNIEIAEELFISEHTVKKHVSNILSKLELSHRTQAAIFANSQTVNF